jgi:hypothetical protein
VFDYVAAFLYEGDAPLAERKAQALTLDRNLLRELIGGGELRDLLDACSPRWSRAQQSPTRAQRRRFHDLLAGSVIRPRRDRPRKLLDAHEVKGAQRHPDGAPPIAPADRAGVSASSFAEDAALSRRAGASSWGLLR